MTPEQIQRIILKTTGDPSCGPIVDNAEAIADAIYRELSGDKPGRKETRLAAKPEIPAAEQ
jgi:hypothetical protein